MFASPSFHAPAGRASAPLRQAARSHATLQAGDCRICALAADS